MDVDDSFTADQVLARLVSAKVEDAPLCARAIEAEVATLPAAERGARARMLTEACAAGTPLAYLLGKQRFMGLELLSERGVVVPRAITERVGQAALKLLAGMRDLSELRVIDMCGGSGNLACAIAYHEPRARVWSCDLMPQATALAQRNVQTLGLSERVTLRTGDLFGALAGEQLEGGVELVVCAPPFISTGRLAKDRAHLLTHEPREAFDAGPYGLTIHQRTAAEAAAFLKPGGYLVFEAGEGQAKQVSLVLNRTRNYEEVTAIDDGDGLCVVVSGRRK